MATLIMGSSHVRRFEDYVKLEKLERFNMADCPPVHYTGIGGAQIFREDHIYRLRHAISQYSPSHCIVHIGGNDLDSAVAAEEIILRLVTFLSMWQNVHSIGHITVLQLLPRLTTRVISPVVYNQKVIEANQILKEQLQTLPNMSYWKLKGMKGADNTLCDDGVHFSVVGQSKYYRNIRAAMLKFVNT